MAQVKKDESREAILKAAYRLFAKNGYHGATLREIAEKAGMSLSNVYVYFPSKYKLLFEVYDPWMTERLSRLERETMEIDDPEARIRHIIVTLWRDIPAEQSGFARNVMQALTVAIPNKEYDPSMIRWAEAKITRLLVSSLPPLRRSLAADGSLAHIIMMAFDGFAINHGLNPNAACTDAVVDAMCRSLMGH